MTQDKRENIKKGILFLNLIDYDSFDNEPLGLCSIAGELRKKGINTKILNFDIRRQGLEIVLEQIIKSNMEVIGISLFDLNIDFAIRLMKKIKKYNNRIILTCGGHFATYNIKRLLNGGDIDYIFKGEGEKNVVEFMMNLNNEILVEDIKGIAYRRKGKIIETEEAPLIEDLDSLAWPVRDILESNINTNDFTFARILTARGCVGRCEFCSTPVFNRGRWRGRSMDDVVNEIEFIVKKYDIRKFIFNDASLEDPGEIGIERLYHMCELLLERNLPIRFAAFFRAETVQKYPKLFQQLRAVGLTRVFLGIESLVQEDLRRYKKIATISDNKLALNILKNLDISIQVGFIMFHPETTETSVIKNMECLNEMDISYMAGIYNTKLQVYTGTPLFSKLSEKI